MSGAVPPPVGPNIQQWARSTRDWLQRTYDKLRWKAGDDNPSVNGSILWDEANLAPVVSKSDAWKALAFSEDVAEVIDHIVIVKEAADLSGTLDSTKAYLIDGEIDMGSTQIRVPSGGLTIFGFSRVTSKLKSTENSYTMFIDPVSGHAGELDIQEVTFEVSGTSSKVFDLDNDENGDSVEFRGVNFLSCPEIGEFDSYRQGLIDDGAFIACVDGITMSGTWAGGFAILTFIIVSAGTDFTGTILKEGTSLTVNGSIRSDMNALQLHSSGEVSDFAPADITNDQEFRMIGVRVNSASDAFPNMPESSVKARFSKCVGTPNTYVGIQWSITSESETSMPNQNTLYKMAGTTTAVDAQWWSQTANNEITYDGSDEIGVVFHMDIPMTGESGLNYNFVARHYVSATASYINLAETGPVTMPSSSDTSTLVSLHAFCVYNQNDRFEVWGENLDDSDKGATMKEGGIVSVQERAS